jgi:hypothetical protein
MPLTKVHYERAHVVRRKKTARVSVKKIAKVAPAAPPPAPTPVEEDAAIPPEITPAPVPEQPAAPAPEVFQSRLDAIQVQASSQDQTDQWQELLNQAITLLESISRHPALQDYAANKHKLDDLQQLIEQSASVR